MTTAEKNVLLTIVDELERIGRAVRLIQQDSNHQPTQLLVANFGNLRKSVDALPTR